MSSRKNLLKIVLPLVIIAVGAAGALLMIKSRQAPQKEETLDPGALVRLMSAERSDHRIRVLATGTVRPAREIEITPQVGGRVTEVSPRFVAGGLFAAGERLFAIEAIDYELAVRQAEANLARAELTLETVRSQARIAREEWQRLELEGQGEPGPLVLYEPQLKEAKANLRSARANLEQARLNLRRTVLEAPFNGRVRSEGIDAGQYVRAGTAVGVFAGTDTAEVVVPLPLEEISHLTIPRQGEGQGSPATVRLELEGERYEWPGIIVRSLGEIDPRGRMARVVVAVDDPYGLETAEDDGGQRPELAIGMFVNVILRGETLPGVFALPRRALRDDSTVWLMDEEQRLRIRQVEVVRREEERIFVGRGLEEGDRIVLTRLSGAADGMKLRPAARQEAQ